MQEKTRTDHTVLTYRTLARSKSSVIRKRTEGAGPLFRGAPVLSRCHSIEPGSNMKTALEILRVSFGSETKLSTSLQKARARFE